jgi:ABC-type uncharacterized transport system permease subunit
VFSLELRERAAWRRYVSSAALAATSVAADGPLFLIEYLLRLVRVVVLISIWRLILAHRGAVSGYSLATVLTYTLVAEVFGEQLACKSELDTAFWEGSLVMRALRPMSLVGQFAAEMIGRWLPGLLFFSLPLLLAAPLLGARPYPADAGAALAFAPSLALAVTVGLALEFLFAGLVLVFDQGIWIVSRIRGALTTLLSGALLPLALLPWGLGGIFVWLPFAAVASAPLRIYTGTGAPMPLLLTQALWALVLWPLARWLWARQRERLVGYGG